MLKGIAASNGIVIAKAYKFEALEIEIVRKSANVEEELTKLENAVQKTITDIEQIKASAVGKLHEEDLAIFDAHLMVAQDPELVESVKNTIRSEEVNAEYAIDTVANMFIGIFEAMEDEYMRARAADIKDVTTRLKANVLGLTIPNLGLINEEVIVVAEDLTPSDTAQLNKKYTKGFVTAIGGRTSHSAIMARSLEIPAVVGCSDVLNEVQHGDLLILDAVAGEVFVNPSEEQVAEYKVKQAKFLEEKEALKVLKDAKSVTVDGHHVEIAGNIGTPKDVDGVLTNGGEAIGLYRSEFLYMDATELPSEEQQFEAYKTVLESMEGKRVVVRTLDIGGDKELPYLKFPKEMNPFLGYRAIRLCLDRKDIFRVQLRALIRASAYGKLAIMFPMIATLDEFNQAKALYNEEKANLVKEGYTVADDIEVGMMVEIPAAAILADQFAKVADFVSIGTNDLIQYSMAADRMSENVAYLYQPFNPSILRLIKATIDGAHSQGRWAGMCGEMAGEPLAVPILLGLGLDEFSMSASSILKARQIVTKLNKKEMEALAQEALQCGTSEEVIALVKAKVQL